MAQECQIQHFVPVIHVSFMVTVNDSTFFKYTYMPAVPRAGDRLRLLINKKEHWFMVKGVEYIEEKYSYDVDLQDVPDDVPDKEEIQNDLCEDPDWR